MRKHVGEKIKNAREQRHLTQSELAGKAGVALSTLSYIEKGGRRPRFETLHALCAALDMTILELLTSEEDTTPRRFLHEERTSAAVTCGAQDFEKYLYRLYLKDAELPPPGHQPCESEMRL